LKFKGNEKPRDVILALAGEGYWLWDEDQYRIILFNGTDYYKISKFPDRPTMNHLDNYYRPQDTIESTPNLAYMRTFIGDSKRPNGVSLSTKIVDISRGN